LLRVLEPNGRQACGSGYAVVNAPGYPRTMTLGPAATEASPAGRDWASGR
jgi:Zn-dependent M28 family amino/carboxypeptidase